MHSEKLYRYEIHAFHGREFLMKYRLQKITSDSVIYYDTVEWDHHGFVPQDEIHAQEAEEMGRVSLKFAVPSYRCREKWICENSFERHAVIIIVIITPRWKDYRRAESERETREDAHSAVVYLDDNQIARTIGTRIREQMWFPQGLTVQSGRSGACGIQAELQGNGDDRDNHRRP